MKGDFSPMMRRMRKAYLARRGVDLDAVDLIEVDPDRNPLLTVRRRWRGTGEAMRSVVGARWIVLTPKAPFKLYFGSTPHV
jgi:hypothetical protein